MDTITPPPDPSASSLSVSVLTSEELCRRCRQETAAFRRGADHDDSFCFAVFRRAIVEGDERCWAELHAVYHDQVLAWCHKSGATNDADADELIALTWEKFWRNFTPDKLDASSGAGGVLSYLKMCARSVVVDESRRRSQAVPLDDVPLEQAGVAPSVADEYLDFADRVAFWGAIQRYLHDERERVLMHLTFELGMRSAEVQALRPDLFPSITEVYRLTRNILDRLRRGRDLREWLREE